MGSRSVVCAELNVRNNVINGLTFRGGGFEISSSLRHATQMTSRSASISIIARLRPTFRDDASVRLRKCVLMKTVSLDWVSETKIRTTDTIQFAGSRSVRLRRMSDDLI